MFIGEFNHTIDSKNRVAVPFRFRRELGKGAILAKSTDRCLTIYPRNEWGKVAEQLNNLPMFDPKAKTLRRFIFSSATDFSLDHQGRVLVPAYLSEYANFNKDVVFIGLYTKIEVWSKKDWLASQEKTGVGTEKFEKDLQELGI